MSILNMSHNYHLHVGKKVVASANTLADCRSLANHLFNRDASVDVVDVYAWGCPSKQALPSFSYVLSIQVPQAIVHVRETLAPELQIRQAA